MTAARMTAAELGAFLRMFDYDDLTIVHADGRTCQVTVTAIYSIPNT
jgi:hypothetical protein